MKTTVHRFRAALQPFLKPALLLIALAMVCCPIMAQEVITTLATCNQTGGSSQPTGTNVCVASNTVVDTAGNIYFSAGEQIGMLSPSGTVTTIAGTGTYASSGDGGPALAASFVIMGQIALQGTQLCFGDGIANTIRCVDLSSGLIQSMAGGAQGLGGDGVAFDAAGNLYVSSFAGNYVHEIAAGTGAVTIFAGSASGWEGFSGDGGPAINALLLEPKGLYYYNGGIYIADQGNDRVRRVDLTLGTISTVAGDGSPYYASSSEGGPALSAGMVPESIVMDGAGNLFINTGTAVREVNTSGIINTIAGIPGTTGDGSDDVLATQTVFAGVMGLGWDPVADRLLIADYSGHLRQIFFTPPTTTTLTPSQNPVAPGGEITLQATVSPVTATGSVRFYLGPTAGTPPVSVPLTDGVATTTWTAPIGAYTSYQLKAVYGGDPNDNLSLATITENLLLTTTTTTITSSVNPSTPGQNVTFTVTVNPPAATGQINLMRGSVLLNSANLSGGVATFNVSYLPAGTWAMSAQYLGNSYYATSTSAAVSQVVGTASVTSLTAAPNPSVYGGSVTLTAAVSPSAATGSVQFFNGATLLGSATLSSGQGQLSITTLPVGANSLTAVYSGDATYLSSTSAAVAQTVTTAPVVMTMTASPNPATAYQPITLTATVSPVTATGTVQFVQYQPPAVGIWGTVTLANGTATLTVPSLAPGTYNLGANYSGDANFQSMSWGMPLVVKPAPPSSVTLTSSLDPAALGQTVTFTAVVSPATATGTVNFMDGSTLLGTVTISGGTAALSVSTLSIGAHLITAAYSGDANDAASTSTSLLQAVNKTVSSVGLTSSANPSTFGQSVTLTAFVAPASATGTVQFVDTSTLAALGTATISGGTAVLPVSTLAAGVHLIGATYSGDANDAGSNSVLLTQTVNKTVASVALASSLNPSTLGQSVTLSATVTPGTATGGVQFLDGSTVLGAVAVSGGSAALSLSSLTAGTHSITAVYSGDANDATSTSVVLTQTVNKIASSVALASAANPSTFGQSVALSAAVTPGTATGSVQFLDGASVLGAATVSNGAATLSLTTLSAGAHSITAVYSGDANYLTSTSPAVAQTVNRAPTSLTLSTNPNPSICGARVLLTAELSGQPPATGTIQFLDGVTVLGTAPVNPGGDTFAEIWNFSAGAHSLTAVYSGDANYLASTSAPVTQTVNKIASSVAVASSLNPSTFNQTIALSALVTPTTANGTVQFLDGSASLGTAPVSGGAAVLSLASLSVGAHSITAVYSGDANDAASTSAILSQTVNKAASSVTLASSLNPSTFGQVVTLAAAVTPSAATGTVQFLDGSTVLGTATISSGSAVLSISSLAAGAHSITAAYSGDANDVASTSAVLAETVQKAATTTAILSSETRVLLGQSVPFTVAVTPAAASGTVNLMTGTTILATSTLSNGTASFNISGLPAGSTPIYAQYAGSASYSPSSSPTQNVVIVLPCSTVLTTTPNPSAYGAPVTLTLTVTPSAATGTVQFNNGATILGTVNLVNGQARLTVNSLPIGANPLIAYYPGDANYVGFTSLVVTQTVNKAPATVALASSRNPSASGQSVTFTAAVSPNSATGTVEFLDGSTVLGTVTIASGSAALSLSSLAVGSHSIKAVYSGDGNYLTGTSAVLTQSVTGAACHVTYAVTTQWNVGFGTAITIQNTGTTPVNGWNLTWTWPGNQKITESWDSTYSQSGANAKLTNASYNAAIAPGATISGIGFNASYSGANTAPAAFSLNGTLCK